MGYIHPADKSTFPYGYGMLMMNSSLRRFQCEQREKIWKYIEVDRHSVADDRSANGRNRK
jgi:hypothetical protein